MRGIDRLGCQDRKDLLAEVLVEPDLRRFVQRFVADHVHARGGQRRLKLAPHLVLVGDQSVGLDIDRCKLLRRRQTIGRAFLDAECLMRLQAGHADHEEFIEIARRDRQEADAFKQRMVGIARFFQDPAIEREPAELAIEVARLGLRGLSGSGDSRHFGDVVH